MSARIRSVGQRREAALAASKVACATFDLDRTHLLEATQPESCAQPGPPRDYPAHALTDGSTTEGRETDRPQGTQEPVVVEPSGTGRGSACCRCGSVFPDNDGVCAGCGHDGLNDGCARFWEPTPEEFEEVKRQLDADARGSKP